MITVTRNVICPQCGRIMGTRQAEYTREGFLQCDDIVSDMICRKCREKKELEILNRARQQSEA